MRLSGHSILIVESEVGSFVARLQTAIEDVGAESLVARDAPTALQRCERFRFSAALVNAEHRQLMDQLSMPSMLYVREEPPKGIVASLESMLGS
jgi:hypothetical protein